MKLNLNLATRRGARRQDSLPTVFLGLVAGTVVLILMFVSLGIYFAEVRKVSRAIKPLRDQQAALAEQAQALQNSFNQPESQAVLQRTRFANSLIEHKGFSVVKLITALEAVMPAQVRLSSLSLERAGPQASVRLTATARTEKDLTTFLSQLESSRNFREVVLGSETSSPEAPTQHLNLNLTFFYVGANRDPNGK